MNDIDSMLRTFSVPAIFFGSVILSPLVAIRKRYAPWYWVFACGPIGLLTIAYLPSLKSAKDPEEYERLEKRANLIGSILSGITLFALWIPFAFILIQVARMNGAIP